MTFKIRRYVVCIGPRHSYIKSFGHVTTGKLESWFLGRRATVIKIH